MLQNKFGSRRRNVVFSSSAGLISVFLSKGRPVFLLKFTFSVFYFNPGTLRSLNHFRGKNSRVFDLIDGTVNMGVTTLLLRPSVVVRSINVAVAKIALTFCGDCIILSVQ